MNMEKMSAKGGSAAGGDTQEINKECCRGFCGKHNRKVVIIILAVLLGFAVLAIAKKVHSNRNFAGAGCASGQYAGDEKMLARCGLLPSDLDPFYPPTDAAKKGELTVVAADASHVTQAVSDIAAKNSGYVTSTKISYAANGVKRGSIVIQISADKFESVFNSLKAMGARVVKESTEVLPQNNIVYPMSATEQNVPIAADQKNQSESGVATSAIYPMPSPFTQDKGYIRINFSDNGKSWGGSGWVGGGADVRNIAISGNDFVVIFGHNLLKGSFLILLIAILLWFVKMLKEQKAKASIKKSTIPAVKKVTVKKAVAVKRSKVVRKR